ncbi:MAG: MvaI/BcnI restriction endonuclease family protein [Chromatiales bacterium]|nr:MvaI/BcnI restriction endonuclease family protein [Chromatiales bacterium]
MPEKIKIFDNEAAKILSVKRLVELYRDMGVSRIYYKLLSPNDNSKNQPYLAGQLTDLAFLPTGKIEETETSSNKQKYDEFTKRSVKYLVEIDFSWLSAMGDVYPAPDAKIIYYPQYPEARLSGFVSKTLFDNGGWMDPAKKGRSEGRVLFLGVKDKGKSGEIFAYLATPETRVAKEILEHPSIQMSGVFNELSASGQMDKRTTREVLIEELARIHKKEWIGSKRLDAAGNEKTYKAQNGGGYTLEAELGVIPNGIAEPDFMGWEIKQFGVSKCHLINSKSLTVMTPEPDGGYYHEQGAEAFVRKYGYSVEEKPGRYDFTGRHFANDVCVKSGMMLQTIGFDSTTGTITDASGSIALIDENGNPASVWTFTKIMEHWKRKHAKAAYVPSLSTSAEGQCRSYNYCNNIRLFTGTSFIKLLKAFNDQHVYYDPGINIKNADTKPVTKRRSQFRIKSSELINLYDEQEDVDVLKND